MLNMFGFICVFTALSVSFTQKMDKNKDGVVTLEEFVIACQEVGGSNDHEFRQRKMQMAASSNLK